MCVERSLVPKAKISPTTHVQLLQWLHGKQQQHDIGFVPTVVLQLKSKAQTLEAKVNTDI